MKIVYLSQFYYPEPHSIHKELAETLVKYGHEVIVVTSYPNYPIGSIYEGWEQKLFGEWESISGVSVLRCPVWPNHSKSVFLRGLHFISFTLSSMILTFFRVSKADIFFVHHPPPSLAIIAWLFNRGDKCPYVFRVADMWPESIAGAGVSHNKLLMNVVEFFMHFIYKTTSHITVPSPGFKRRLVDKGLSGNKITVIPNFADEATYFPYGKNKELQQRLGIKSTDIIILYAGSIGTPQRIDVLVDSMKRIKHRKEIKLLIIGDGLCKKNLEWKCLNEEVKSVTFFNQMLPEEVNRCYSIADALFIQLEDQPIWNDNIPSKVYAYMLSGRPIIAALRGDGADVVSESHGGYICEPCNADAIADCILRIADLSIEERELMGKNNYNYAIDNYSKDLVIKRLETVLINVINEAKPKPSSSLTG
jgi:colanic acid biosynthesis glycosyl transferase WcaI